jgi:hypothetical protein
MSLNAEQTEVLKRVRRVSDMLCTAHAVLRDRFSYRALTLDIVILACLTWIVALAFVSSTVAARLTPFGWDSIIWLGCLSAATFFLTLVQLKTDWKSKADAHKRTLALYADVKREAGYLLASNQANEEAFRRVLAGYDMASAAGVEIPEKNFLTLKRKHKIKITLSKHLDEHPFTSILLFRLRMWLRDNRAEGEE